MEPFWNHLAGAVIAKRPWESQIKGSARLPAVPFAGKTSARNKTAQLVVPLNSKTTTMVEIIIPENVDAHAGQLSLGGESEPLGHKPKTRGSPGKTWRA